MSPTSHRSGDPRADRRAEYAESYARSGDPAAAADLMRQAVELAPRWSLGRMRLAAFLEETGERSEAAAVLRAVLAEDAADPYGASLRLAALGEAPVPVAPPPAFVAGLFDQYAAGFDAALVGRLRYGVPAELLAAIRTVAGERRRFARALDLGCGTGLMGERLRPLVGRLEGIDLSPGMLDKARAKRLYDRLAAGDILEADGGPFDLVTAADVLTYLGDLEPVFAHVAALLAPGALFAFSVEAEDEAGTYALRPSLRYAHAPKLLAEIARRHGFETVLERRLVLREDRGEPVPGAILVLRRPLAR